MGKKDGLGRSLVKSRFGASKGKKTVDNGSMLHSTVVQDGYDWGRLNLQSVTEESSFQEFLSTAELANTEFQAEKLNLKLVALNSSINPVTTAAMRESTKLVHDESKHLLRVPRRPTWGPEMTAAQVHENEREAFLNWRRDLALLQDRDNLILTPYEKNLEFWRQLWRVLERSHIFIQVVDARNPLLFRCEDLETYAKEIGVQASMLLLNKADLLTDTQRRMWAEYFDKQGIKVAFFSASLAAEQHKLDNEIPEETGSDINSSDVESDTDEVNNTDDHLLHDITNDVDQLEKSVDDVCEKINEITSKLGDLGKEFKINPTAETKDDENKSTEYVAPTWEDKNQINILGRQELMDLLRSIQTDCSGRLCIGLVGYPNVGKSSTINALMTSKKVSVSATPGKTKHFQTLLLEDDLMLCDCPGLVLPSFVCTKADMVVHGILPIDHMREYMEAITIVTEGLGGRIEAERRLGILLPPPPPDDPTALPARDLLNAYAYSRGMMTGMGQPDCARAARAILRAATKGLLPVVVCPPGYDLAEYMSTLYPPLPDYITGNTSEQRRQMTPQEARALKHDVTTDDVDKNFFGGRALEGYQKGVAGKFYGLPTERQPNAPVGDGVQIAGKPWKQFNKHVNKKKKEKLRRIYAHLDQH